eukprot:scaffold13910_cov96-Isochrysis_galbana.AAC.4
MLLSHPQREGPLPAGHKQKPRHSGPPRLDLGYGWMVHFPVGILVGEVVDAGVREASGQKGVREPCADVKRPDGATKGL